MSIAIQKRSRGVSVKRPSRSSAAANATECTRMSSSPPNTSATSREDALDRGVVADVELGDERARDRFGELAHALLDALALERERDLRAALGEPAGDRPRDRPLVGDPKPMRAFPENIRGDAIPLRILCGALRRPLLLTLAIALVASAAASAAPQPLHREVREQGFAARPRRAPDDPAEVGARHDARDRSPRSPPLAAWNAARPPPPPARRST